MTNSVTKCQLQERVRAILLPEPGRVEKKAGDFSALWPWTLDAGWTSERVATAMLFVQPATPVRYVTRVW